MKAHGICRWFHRLHPSTLGIAGSLCAAVITAVVCFDLPLSFQTARIQSSLAEGDLQVAFNIAQDLAKSHPDHAQARYYLAKCARRTDQLELAAKELQLAERLGHHHTDLVLEQWLAIAQSGDVQSVEPKLRQLMAAGVSDNQAEEIYEAMAKGFFASYRISDLRQCLDYWSEWRPDAVLPHLMRADLHERLGEWTHAVEQYRRILKLVPNHVQASLKLAQALLELNDASEALEVFNSCRVLQPNHPEVLLGIAQCQSRLGHPEIAMRFLKLSLQQPVADRLRAKILLESGQIKSEASDYTGALADLTAAVQIAPSDASIHHALSLVYTRQGDSIRAQESSRRCVDIRSQFERCLEISRRLIVEPENVELRYETGMIMINQGLLEEGAAWLRTVLQYDPTHLKAHTALAIHYSAKGMHDLANYHRLAATPKR
jgi:tetratricopeptide (TPR) repeat protein